MPSQAIAVGAAQVRVVGYFSAAHPVARVAALLCSRHAPRGLVACGWCWERAVRDAVRAGLDPGFVPDFEGVPPVRVNGHFRVGHPLASVAARLCRRHARTGRRLGQSACGACWEQAIRSDEVVVVEHGLPRELVTDPDLVDEVAVGLACRGVKVELNLAERDAVTRRLMAQGLTYWQVVALLGIEPRMPVPADVAPAGSVTVIGGVRGSGRGTAVSARIGSELLGSAA